MREFEVVARKIVESISMAQVGRYLQQAAVQPHRSKMWLKTTEKDAEKFQREVEIVCQTYLDAPAKAATAGTHTVSVDEATSLQATERNAPDKLVQPGHIGKQEFEYTRHGTTTLKAGVDVVTGQIVSPTLEPTRTEPEFVQHMARTGNARTNNFSRTDWHSVMGGADRAALFLKLLRNTVKTSEEINTAKLGAIETGLSQDLDIRQRARWTNLAAELARRQKLAESLAAKEKVR